MKQTKSNYIDLIKAIADSLDILTVLDCLGIKHYGNHRNIQCPIHNGTGNNFSIFDNGRAWTCFSHSCGSGHKRDGLNLFCLLEYSRVFPDLQPEQKTEALKKTASIVGIDPSNYKSYATASTVGIFDGIPDLEKQALLEIMNDTDKLEVYGRSNLYTNPISQKIILFLAAAKSEGMLPKTITHEWDEYINFNNYIKRKD